MRQYEPIVDQFTVKIAADSLRIISEENHQAETLQQARAVIADARHVLFLGFGYHQENLSRLGFPINAPKMTVHGSCYGMTTTEIDRAKHCFFESLLYASCPMFGCPPRL
jgi:hypothetical protein